MLRRRGAGVHDLSRDYEDRHGESVDEQDVDPGPRGVMSPLIRELIISYGGREGERTWNAAAFGRQGRRSDLKAV